MRRTSFLLTCILVCASLLGSCANTAEPPTADEQAKRPANNAPVVALQRCLHELHNEGLRAEESRATLASLAAQVQACQRARTSRTPADETVTIRGRQVFVIHFAFASSEVQLTPDAEQTLLNAAKSAPWIVLHGRTDGLVDNLADARLAKARAERLRDLLTSHGIDPARVRTTYQPTGDAVAPNTDANARSLNRRVEVEIHDQPPAPATSLNAAG
jgi:outer membrane protein OmpA-like peptidoglycan-associated protein